MKGSYILLIELAEEQIIKTGSRNSQHFLPGQYAYVGSAMGGFKSRLGHHLKDHKKLHWHIDYLLQKAVITNIILCQTHNKVECMIADALKEQFAFVPGFGSSDCQCRSHLFFSSTEMKLPIMATLRALGMTPQLARDLRRGWYDDGNYFGKAR